MNVRHIDYPQTKDAIAMVSKLSYEDLYDKALRYIFGRTLICRNLEVATQLARTTGKVKLELKPIKKPAKICSIAVDLFEYSQIVILTLGLYYVFIF